MHAPNPTPAAGSPTPPAPPARSRSKSVVRFLAAAALVLVPAAAVVHHFSGMLFEPDGPVLPPGMSTYAVKRANMDMIVRAKGELEAADKTLIQNLAEAVTLRNAGSSRSSRSTNTIIFIVPDGTEVQAGDLICELDASEYEELYSQQLIKVEQERAQLVQSELALEVARINRMQFDEGTRLQNIQTYQGQISLGESDLTRAQERLDWTRQMKARGYTSEAQVQSEEISLRRTEISLERTKSQLETYLRFTVPKTLRQLDSNIASREVNVANERSRLKINEERLASLKRQIENCRIYAPHDGMVVYAKDENSNETIREGAQVFYKQDMFYLPDLDRMVVKVWLNETVVNRVRAGMRARVIPEGRGASAGYSAVVEKVDQFPERVDPSRRGNVKNYLALVRIEGEVEGLLPGLSAQVEILTNSISDCVVVPTLALYNKNGRDHCFVAAPDGSIVARPVRVGGVNEYWAEIVAGLNEGETILPDWNWLGDEIVGTLAAAVADEDLPAPPTSPVANNELTENDDENNEWLAFVESLMIAANAQNPNPGDAPAPAAIPTTIAVNQP